MLKGKTTASRTSIRRDIIQGMDAIKIVGPFDSTLDVVLSYSKDIQDEGKNAIVLDMSEVSYMTSAGLATIIKLVKFVQNAEIKLFVFGATQDMKDYIELSSLEAFLAYL